MRQPIAVLGLTVALAGCTMHARTGSVGDDTPGAAVARAIDIQIVPALQSLRGVAVGHAACPENLDVSQGKTGYCTLSVGESTVRIAVTGGHEYGKFVVKQADTVIDMREIERRERALLSDQYDLHADVRCGQPRIRIARPEAIRCGLSGGALPVHHVDVKVLDGAGHVEFVKPHGVESPTMSALMPYVRAHDTGSATAVPGGLIARFIPKMMHQLAEGPVDRMMPLGAATCPATIDLSGARRGLCRQRVGNKAVRVAVWIDRSTGFRIQTLDYALSTKAIADNGVQLYRNKLRALGLSEMVAVDCGPDRIVVGPAGHGIPCTLTFGAKTRAMTVRPTPDGRLNFEVPGEIMPAR